MRGDTQEINQMIQTNAMLGPYWEPCACHLVTDYGQALRTCPWVTQGVVCMVFGLDLDAILVTCGTYIDQL